MKRLSPKAICVVAAVLICVAAPNVAAQRHADFPQVMGDYVREAQRQLRQQAPGAQLNAFFLGDIGSKAQCENYLAAQESFYRSERRLALSVENGQAMADRQVQNAQAVGVQFQSAALVGAYVERCDDNTIVEVMCGCSEVNSDCIAYGLVGRMSDNSCQSATDMSFSSVVQRETQAAQRTFQSFADDNFNTIDLRH